MAVVVRGAGLLARRGGLATRLEKQARKRRSARFAAREKVDPGMLYEQRYRDKGVRKETVARVFAMVGEEYEIDPETLRPDDTFDGTLAPERGYIGEDAIVWVSDTVMEQARAAGMAPDLSKVATLDDLVMLCAEIERAERK
jgi:hypothetical protein